MYNVWYNISVLKNNTYLYKSYASLKGNLERVIYMISVKKELDFEDLKKECWSGAVDTLQKIEEEGKEDELMELLQDIFTDIPTETELNDFLWFDDDYIYEQLGIEEE